VVVLAAGLSLAGPAQAMETTARPPVRAEAGDRRSDGPGAAGLLVGTTLLLGWATTGALLLRQGRRRLGTSAPVADAHVVEAVEPR
jgi:hypothetical protein